MTNNRAARLSADPGLSATAWLIGNPVRAAILSALLDGNELSAGELARRAGSAKNAASVHLAKLVDGGLLTSRATGRRRLYRLSNAEVGAALEAIALIAKPAKIVALSQATAAERLSGARSCYDHLAGKLGVAVTGKLVARKVIVELDDVTYELTRRGDAFLTSLGIDVALARRAQRSFARKCMDWSERRPHLAGALGAAVRDLFLSERWVHPVPGSRALRVIDAGRSALRSVLALEF